MRKIWISFLLISLMIMAVSCKKSNADSQQISIAVITTSAVNDKAFNQEAYEEASEFAAKYNAKCRNYVTPSSQNSAIGETFSQASADGCNVFILMGYAFIRSILQFALKYPNVKFIGIDINDADMYNMAESLGMIGYKIPKNVYCCSFYEHYAGFMAGYAAIREGYTHLGFLGGRPVPAVIRYGLGYVQGIDFAAREMNIADKVIVEYAYSKSFSASGSITESMKQWFTDGVQVLFPCGGGIWTSGAAAAAEYNGRVIGVDIDQSSVINTYGANLCLTSAVKNIGRSVGYILDIIREDRFDEFGGKADTLGMVSGDDPDMNFLRLPMESWTMTKFTKEDYKQLVGRIYNEEIKIAGAPDDKPEFSITLNVYPMLK